MNWGSLRQMCGVDLAIDSDSRNIHSLIIPYRVILAFESSQEQQRRRRQDQQRCHVLRGWRRRRGQNAPLPPLLAAAPVRPLPVVVLRLVVRGPR